VKRPDPQPKRAIVLLSGGLDSATVLAIARAEGYEPHCVSFDYTQRHGVELESSARVAKSLGAASHRVVTLDPQTFQGSALTGDADVPKGRDSAAMDDIPVTYVPARNLVFLSIALGIAETTGARDLYIGANQVDYSGYPDCRVEFLESFIATANLATKSGVQGDPFRLHAPLLDMTKAQIIARGTELGVDYALTSSCYDPDDEGRACGACDSCTLRREGFEAAGVPDPTRYAGSHA
jgi:7-cyano-7-deazaguanine synthase